MDPTIVCAVDDDGSPRAVAVAADLAERLGRELIVVHAAIPGPVGTSYPPAGAGLALPPPAAPDPLPATPEDDVLRQRRRSIRERLEQRIAGSGASVPRIEVVLAAAVPDTLRRFAGEQRAELLVVGSRGRGAARAAVLGSTAHDLVRESPCPVLVVPLGD